VGALARLIEHPQAVGQIFNVGSAEEISIRELAMLVKTMTGSASPIQYIPYDEAYEEGFEDMHRRVPDISRIRNLLNFQPSHDICQIVQSVIRYFDEHAEESRLIATPALAGGALKETVRQCIR
jgi:UDP-glucose 4-epimerase